MNYAKLSGSLAVAGQIQPDDVPQLADAGFRVIVNNRPDGEEPDQPAGAEIAAAAAAAGLDYHYMPVTHRDFPGPDLASFAGLVAEGQPPVFAFCRSGTRCANLWLVSRAPDDLEPAIATARAYGFDLGMALHFLQEKGGHRDASPQ